jgi:hypothetical protein
VPGHPVPSIHADASISRFPLRPVTYVPSRGDGPPGATIWLHAPDGFLRLAGTFVTAAAAGLAAHFLFSFGWRAAFLLGTALAPTCPAGS